VAGTEQTWVELIHVGGKMLHSEVHKLIHSVLNKKELPQQWKESVISPISPMELIIVILEEYHCHQLHYLKKPAIDTYHIILFLKCSVLKVVIVRSE